MEILSDPGKQGKSSTARGIALTIFGSVMVAWWVGFLVAVFRIPEGEATWDHLGPFFTQMWPAFVGAVAMYGLNVGKDVLKARERGGAA